MQRQNDFTGIWAVILAAGESKRMNSPKLLLPFRGKTIIETVVENVKKSLIENIMVVVGSSHEGIEKAIGKLDVRTHYNSDYRDGMLSSVKCGLNSLPDEFTAVVVLQGDQPMIKSSVIDSLVSAWISSEKGIVIPVHKKKRGHPILIDRRYRSEVNKLVKNEGLNALSVRFYYDILEIDVDTPDILRDIDTRDDYLKEINQSL